MRTRTTVVLCRVLCAFAALMAPSIGFGQVTLSLSSGSGTPGASVTLNLSLSATSGNRPAGVQWTLNYPTSDFSSIGVAAGSAATAAGKSLTCNGSAGSSTCIVWGLNSTQISNGVVATVVMVISSSTLSTSSTIQLTAGQAALPAGNAVSTTTTGTTVTIVQPPVTNYPPTVSSVTPSSGAGMSGSFRFVYSDQNGYSDLSNVTAAFQSSSPSCYVYVVPASNSISLFNDSGSSYLGPIQPGSSATVQNSQCQINGTGSSISGSGNNLTVVLSVIFKPAFAGSKTIYGGAHDQSSAGQDFVQLGTWVVPAVSKVGTYNLSQGVFLLDVNGNYLWDGAPPDLFFMWGSPNKIPVLGDWNGTGTKKIGIFDPTTATWMLDMNGNGVWDGPSIDKMVQWGSPGDVPVVGNWNGVGTQDKIGTFTPSAAVWLLDYNGNFAWDGAPTDKYFSWGSSNDKPMVGNWNGVGNQDKVGVFNPSQGWWVLDYNGNFVWDGTAADRFFHWGSPGDTPVVGDWNGTGTVKVGIYNSTQAVFLLDYNGNFIWDGTPTDKYFAWGSPNDKPVVGDWNGTGTTKVGVFNSSQGWWVLDYNGNFAWDGSGTDKYFYWGSPGDAPLVGRW